MVKFLKAAGLLGLVAASLLTAGVVNCRAQGLSSQEYEYQVKVAFIYNLSRFVNWPPDRFSARPESLTVCVLGTDPFGAALETIQGKNVEDKHIEIRRLNRSSEVDACQILFVSSSEKERLAQILDTARRSGVLTIGEMNQFNQAGGIVALSMRKNRIFFSVNVDAAENTGVKISSQVLRLATIFRADGEER